MSSKQTTSDASGAILNAKGKNQQELAALEVAEDSREKDWGKPSFLADLFMGEIRWASLKSFRLQASEDRRIGDELLEKVDRFLKEKHDAEAVDTTGEIPASVMQGMAELGLFALKIPKEYGGLGLSQTNYMRILARISAHCASTAALLSAHQSIGVPQPLKLFGTPEQKKKYLPGFREGKISAFALTEPGVGSDPAQMSTTATPSEDGKSWILNGTKLWCTNGAIADVLVVMARTPSQFVNGREKKQISAFIVEKGTPGFSVAHRCRFMGLSGIQNALLKFENVKVPAENLLWGEGKGLRLALVTLNAGRLSIPATCIGGIRQGLIGARDWGMKRSQWGAPIGKHEAGATKIADAAAHLFAMEAISALASCWVDEDSHDIRLEAALAKLYGSEQGWRIADSLLQLRGGRGYETSASLRARGEDPMPAERFLRDARINRIVEGTTEIMSLFIAREALDRHLKLAGEVLNPKASLSKRASTAVRAGAFYAIWVPRLAFTYGVARLGSLVSGGMKKSDLWATAQAAKLALTLFSLMLLYGPKLEKRQMQLMRIVGIASEIFAVLVSNAYARLLEGKSFAKDGVFARSADRPEVEFSAKEAALTYAEIAKARVRGYYSEIRKNPDQAQTRLTRGILNT